jgi:hypothetical protein
MISDSAAESRGVRSGSAIYSWRDGTTVNGVGDRLVLFRADAAQLGLIDWKPGDP